VRRDGLVALLYLVIAIGFFADAAIGQGAFFHYDTWMQNYAFRAWWFEQLKDGHFATWCPGMFAGYPLFAETQTGPLYPPTFLLFLALPPTLAFSWSVIVHFALAGWGMHVLVRRFGASFASCLLAGVTFAYSGFLITHVVHFNLLTGAALLPWALYFAAGLLDSARSGERIRPLDFFGLAAVAAGYFLGSHPYALFMALFATIVTAIGWHGLRALSPGALGIAGAWILGAALGAIQLFPAIDLLGRTSRSAPVERGFLTFGSFPPWNLSALANPDVFGTPVDGSFFGGLDWSHFAETCAFRSDSPWRRSFFAEIAPRLDFWCLPLPGFFSCWGSTRLCIEHWNRSPCCNRRAFQLVSHWSGRSPSPHWRDSAWMRCCRRRMQLAARKLLLVERSPSCS
jgi:hypothetical protein